MSFYILKRINNCLEKCIVLDYYFVFEIMLFFLILILVIDYLIEGKCNIDIEL